MPKAVEFKGRDELLRALRRSPKKVVEYTGDYFQDASAVLLRDMKRPAWRVGQSGGGIPEDTGDLREKHLIDINLNQLVARIAVNPNTPPIKYAIWVHEGTKRTKARPWMDQTLERKEGEVDALQGELLQRIVRDLAR